MQHIFNIRCENEMRVQLPLLLIYTTACFYLMLDKIIQALFHPLPPSTAACWLQTVPAGWWRHVCRERERGAETERGEREREREREHLFPAKSSDIILVIPHQPLSLPSPLHHLDVKAEAFVDWIPLPSDTRAQPEHLGRAIQYAVLLTERTV